MHADSFIISCSLRAYDGAECSYQTMTLICISDLIKLQLDKVFHQNSKYVKLGRKYSTVNCVFNSLFSGWKCDEALYDFRDTCIAKANQNCLFIFSATT